jgi:hypothetical protein
MGGLFVFLGKDPPIKNALFRFGIMTIYWEKGSDFIKQGRTLATHSLSTPCHQHGWIQKPCEGARFSF